MNCYGLAIGWRITADNGLIYVTLQVKEEGRQARCSQSFACKTKCCLFPAFSQPRPTQARGVSMVDLGNVVLRKPVSSGDVSVELISPETYSIGYGGGSFSLAKFNATLNLLYVRGSPVRHAHLFFIPPLFLPKSLLGKMNELVLILANSN